jgi:hypothetical protein
MTITEKVLDKVAKNKSLESFRRTPSTVLQ